MSYNFHEIKHNVEPYLADLPTHSKQWDHHVDHLRAIFLRCHDFNIRLNPHKCIFYNETDRLLGFIVSRDDICIDPLKIEVIIVLPTPTNVTQLQSLKGKEIFLRHFIFNYPEKTHSFMRLLKNDTSFFWDDMVHHTFNNLKHALTHAPMLQPLDYIKDDSLYVVASLSTIGMVLVHTDENDQERVIYYISKSLLD